MTRKFVIKQPFTKIYQASFSVFFILISLLFLFQNCSNVSFESSQSSTVAPLCQKMTAAEVAPKLKWDWHQQLDSKDKYYLFDQVMASPIVADLDGDKIPEVLFVTFTTHPELWFDRASKKTFYNKNGVLRVVDGRNGQNKFSIGDNELAPIGDTEPLVIDIDGDGKAEIFYYNYLTLSSNDGALIALNFDGTLRWKYPVKQSDCTRGLSASDFDNNGIAEIILSSEVITESDHKPKLVTTLPESACHAVAFVQNGDAKIFNNNGLYKFNGEKLFSLPPNRFISIADVDQDKSTMELVTSGTGKINIWDSVTGVQKKEIDLNQYTDLLCSGRSDVGGGPVSIGNFDKNKETLEFAIATGRNLTIFKSDGSLLAKYGTQDCSSMATGLTTFDFNGDKVPEIIYSDEEYLRIFQIADEKLEVVFQTPNPSGTLYEYPVVADIDGNGSSELLVVANNYAVSSFYKDPDKAKDKALAEKITGVRAFESAGEQAWMKSRPIWNQYYFSPQLTTDQLRPNNHYELFNSFLRNFEGSEFESTCIEEK